MDVAEPVLVLEDVSDQSRVLHDSSAAVGYQCYVLLCDVAIHGAVQLQRSLRPIMVDSLYRVEDLIEIVSLLLLY